MRLVMASHMQAFPMFFRNSVEQAQSQFEEVCMSMNRFGVKPENERQFYCENRLALDDFMSDAVLSLVNPENDKMRARYTEHVKLLGANSDNNCQRSQFYWSHIFAFRQSQVHRLRPVKIEKNI
jgi:hypothetical protein